jgi:hypothetical protein
MDFICFHKRKLTLSRNRLQPNSPPLVISEPLILRLHERYSLTSIIIYHHQSSTSEHLAHSRSVILISAASSLLNKFGDNFHVQFEELNTPIVVEFGDKQKLSQSLLLKDAFET